MKLVVVSPHLDDAVLSVGASIAALVDAGHHVIVATLFSRVTHPPRLDEDRAALSLLGAAALHLGLDDAPLRGIPCTWRGLIEGDDDLAAVASACAALSALLEREAPEQLWAPLAAGHHVDHRAARAAALAVVPRASLYEDLPYALRPREVTLCLARAGARPLAHAPRPAPPTHLPHLDAFQRNPRQRADADHLRDAALAPFSSLDDASEIDGPLGHRRLERRPIDARSRGRMMAALACYESQLDAIVGGAPERGWPALLQAEALWVCCGQ